MVSAAELRLWERLLKAAAAIALAVLFWAYAGNARAAGLPVATPSTPAKAPAASAVQHASSSVANATKTITGTSEAAAAPATTATPVAAATVPVVRAAGSATKTVEHVARSLPGANQVVDRAVKTAERVETRASGTLPAVNRSTSPPAAAPVANSPRSGVATRSKRIVRAPRPAARQQTRPAKPMTAALPQRVGTTPPAAVAPTRTSPGREAGPARSNHDHSPLPGPTTGPTTGTAPGGAGSALFAAFLLGFLLAVPNAGRWLRSALALGLTPVALDARARPG
jgi:hypothetical protein